MLIHAHTTSCPYIDIQYPTPFSMFPLLSCSTKSRFIADASSAFKLPPSMPRNTKPSLACRGYITQHFIQPKTPQMNRLWYPIIEYALTCFVLFLFFKRTTCFSHPNLTARCDLLYILSLFAARFATHLRSSPDYNIIFIPFARHPSCENIGFPGYWSISGPSAPLLAYEWRHG